MPSDARQQAFNGLLQVVIQGRSLSEVTPTFSSLENNDRALATELVYGTLHHYYELTAIANGLLRKRFKDPDQDVMLCLLMGIYQLRYTRIPDHAAIHETVALCDMLNKDWAKSILNAILRRIQRQPDIITDFNLTNPSRYNLPNWLYDQLTADWPDAHQWLEHMHFRAPLMLRVNHTKITTASYMQQLSDAGIEAAVCEGMPAAIQLKHATDIVSLPGYAKGHFSVQDGAAQWAAVILDPQPGEKILDACAAPGGKTGHILELTNNQCHLVALDNVSERLVRLTENLQRLSLTADIRCGDALVPADWLKDDSEQFDRILCDAPCSATGIIRRHPDIALHRTQKDVKRLNQIQWRMLKSLWNLLKPGGTLVYSTCSILKSENDILIADFIKHHSDASIVNIETTIRPSSAQSTWQIYPGQQQMDGFFYAKLSKQS